MGLTTPEAQASVMHTFEQLHQQGFDAPQMPYQLPLQRPSVLIPAVPANRRGNHQYLGPPSWARLCPLRFSLQQLGLRAHRCLDTRLLSIDSRSCWKWEVRVTMLLSEQSKFKELKRKIKRAHAGLLPAVSHLHCHTSHNLKNEPIPAMFANSTQRTKYSRASSQS